MWTEADVTAWLTAHPFLKSQLILALGAVSSFAVKDWEAFKKYKTSDQAATFNWQRAIKEYGKGIVVAIVPPLVAKVWQILGA